MICYASRGTTLRGASFRQKPCIQSVELGIISTTLDLVRAFLKNPASSFGTWLEFQRFQFATFQRFGFDFTVGVLCAYTTCKKYTCNHIHTYRCHVQPACRPYSAWKHFQDPTRWPMAQGLQLFVRDMCLYDHIGQPQHADWHHYFTAGRLATTQLSIPAVIRQHAFKQRRTISPGLIDHRQP